MTAVSQAPAYRVSLCNVQAPSSTLLATTLPRTNDKSALQHIASAMKVSSSAMLHV